jgi:flagellar protein FlgJ
MNTLNPLLPAKPGSGETADAVAAPKPDPAFVAKATKASVEFESFFIAHMLRQMRSATSEMAGQDSVFNNKANTDMQDMADTMLAGHIAGQRAFGIADAILRQLLPAPLNNSK